ncbi:hypothetical protein CN918_31070 [Priestia megaterium]|nr:hypothetical protein CN918_31070 [Priestia megaterium]
MKKSFFKNLPKENVIIHSHYQAQEEKHLFTAHIGIFTFHFTGTIKNDEVCIDYPVVHGLVPQHIYHLYNDKQLEKFVYALLELSPREQYTIHNKVQDNHKPTLHTLDEFLDYVHERGAMTSEEVLLTITHQEQRDENSQCICFYREADGAFAWYTSEKKNPQPPLGYQGEFYVLPFASHLIFKIRYTEILEQYFVFVEYSLNHSKPELYTPIELHHPVNESSRYYQSISDLIEPASELLDELAKKTHTHLPPISTYAFHLLEKIGHETLFNPFYERPLPLLDELNNAPILTTSFLKEFALYNGLGVLDKESKLVLSSSIFRLSIPYEDIGVGEVILYPFVFSPVPEKKEIIHSQGQLIKLLENFLQSDRETSPRLMRATLEKVDGTREGVFVFGVPLLSQTHLF